MFPFASTWAEGFVFRVEILISAIRRYLPVTGQTSPPVRLWFHTFDYPEDAKPCVESMSWLLVEHSDEGMSFDEWLWWALVLDLESYVGAVADALRGLKDIFDERSPKPKGRPRAIDRLLRQKLFTVSFCQRGSSGKMMLRIQLAPIDNQVLIDLHKEAFTVDLEPHQPELEPAPRQRDTILEERDKLIYEAYCAGKSYKEIRKMIVEKSREDRAWLKLRVTDGRITQIARHEYPQNHGLPEPPPRQARRKPRG
jgi:hypothetical protein